MAIQRRSSGRSRSSATRRKFVWARTTGTSTIPAGPNRNQLDLLASFQTEYGAQLLGATVMRVRGLILLGASEGATVDTTVVGGMRVFTEGSAPGGVVEAPLVDVHADWMAIFPVILLRISTSVTVDPNQRIVVDVRSARRLEELGQGLALSFSQSGAAPLSYRWHLSIGLKLA